MQHRRSGAVRIIRANPAGEAFSRVTVLDGFCLFVPRPTWETHRFDEVTFPGFHLYDLDFSIRVALDRSNFVCHTVLAEHFSLGSFDEAWRVAIDAYHRKWSAQLPISCVPLTPGRSSAARPSAPTARCATCSGGRGRPRAARAGLGRLPGPRPPRLRSPAAAVPARRRLAPAQARADVSRPRRAPPPRAAPRT